MPEDRRLAAIMFTDIVGYTALMGSDEDKAFQLLEKNRNLHKPLIEKFHGTFHKEIGDAVLASFPLATDAVLCAEKLIKATNKVPGLSLRVGIHEGEVVFKEDDAYGDGVNIASRIQDIAIPDSVLVSAKVYDEVKNHPSIKTCSLGFFTFKNVKQSIEVFALVNEGLMIPETKEMLDKAKVKKEDIPHNLPVP